MALRGRSGEYPVKSGYWWSRNLSKSEVKSESLNPIKEELWKISMTPKINMFVWKVLSDGLISSGMRVDPVFQGCGGNGESINHVLFDYTVARQVWAQSNFPFPPSGFDGESIFANIYYVLKSLKNTLNPLERYDGLLLGS